VIVTKPAILAEIESGSIVIMKFATQIRDADTNLGWVDEDKAPRQQRCAVERAPQIWADHALLDDCRGEMMRAHTRVQ